LRAGLVQEAYTFNPAVQTKDFDGKLPNRRVYARGDPLYQLFGRFTSGAKLQPATSIFTELRTRLSPTYFAANALNQHNLSAFDSQELSGGSCCSVPCSCCHSEFDEPPSKKGRLSGGNLVPFDEILGRYNNGQKFMFRRREGPIPEFHALGNPTHTFIGTVQSLKRYEDAPFRRPEAPVVELTVNLTPPLPINGRMTNTVKINDTYWVARPWPPAGVKLAIDQLGRDLSGIPPNALGTVAEFAGYPKSSSEYIKGEVLDKGNPGDVPSKLRKREGGMALKAVYEFEATELTRGDECFKQSVMVLSSYYRKLKPAISQIPAGAGFYMNPEDFVLNASGNPNPFDCFSLIRKFMGFDARFYHVNPMSINGDPVDRDYKRLHEIFTDAQENYYGGIIDINFVLETDEELLSHAIAYVGDPVTNRISFFDPMFARDGVLTLSEKIEDDVHFNMDNVDENLNQILSRFSREGEKSRSGFKVVGLPYIDNIIYIETRVDREAMDWEPTPVTVPDREDLRDLTGHKKFIQRSDEVAAINDQDRATVEYPLNLDFVTPPYPDLQGGRHKRRNAVRHRIVGQLS
jgi:hypothetical protein